MAENKIAEPRDAATDDSRAELVQALRRLLQAGTAVEASPTELNRLARSIHALADKMTALPQSDHFDVPDHCLNGSYSAIGGRLNPLLPFMELEPAKDDPLRVQSRIELPFHYKGPPGAVHGGIVAALHDQILGSISRLHGRPSVTASLKVDYRRPALFDTPLDLCAWVDRIDGRKMWARSICEQGGSVISEGEALLVVVDVKAMAEDARQARETAEAQASTE